MNNINFFNQFNQLLNNHVQTHKDINHLIHNQMELSTNEQQDKHTIINKYIEMNDILNIFLNNITMISNDIKTYLNENCKHNWTTDYIDIDPEKTIQIEYCDICNSINS